MRNRYLFKAIAFLLFLLVQGVSNAQYLKFVNPLMGSAGVGFVTPISSVPFGMLLMHTDPWINTQ